MRNMQCKGCGSESMIGGSIIDSNGGPASFLLDDASIWKKMFGGEARRIKGYGCVRCGHFQLTVDFTERDLERYLQFEGQQPSVLERLNLEPAGDE